jgi:hypothetical protein
MSVLALRGGQPSSTRTVETCVLYSPDSVSTWDEYLQQTHERKKRFWPTFPLNFTPAPDEPLPSLHMLYPIHPLQRTVTFSMLNLKDIFATVPWRIRAVCSECMKKE